MDITAESMQGLFTVYSMALSTGMGKVSKEHTKFCMEMNHKGSKLSLPWIEAGSGMKEWSGERKTSNVDAKKLDLAARMFQDSVSVPKTVISDDEYGVYASMFEQLGFSAESLWGQLAAQVLVDMGTSKWVDGKTFLSDTRKYGNNVLNNKGTAPFSYDAYAAARVAMLSFKNSAGSAMNIVPNLLIVGPENELAAADATMGTRREASGVAIDNPLAGKTTYTVVPELGSQWFLAACNGVYKPVVVWKRTTPVFTADDDVSKFRETPDFKYGVEARGEAAATLPHLIYGSIPA